MIDKQIKMKRASLVLLIIVLSVLLLLYLSRETQSLSLDSLTVNTDIFSEEWQVADTYSYSKNEANGASENLMIVWDKDEIMTPDNSKPKTYMFSRRFNHFLHATYKFNVLTSEETLPSQIFFVPDKWNYESNFADQTHVVCSWPNAGSYCKVIAQYGSYIVSFQYESQANEDLVVEIQTIWEKIDNHIGQKLNK